MELKGRGKMNGEVRPIVAAWIEMEFVRDVARGEDFVERQGAGVEAEVVPIATVEIDVEPGEPSRACKSQRAVAFPKPRIWRCAEDPAKDAFARRTGGNASEEDGKFFDERCAMGADGRKKLWVTKSQMERAIATHGNAGDGAIGASGMRAIAALYERNEFLEQEIFVTVLAVARIDVEARSCSRSDNQKRLELTSFPEILDKIPAAGAEEQLFVISETVEKINNGEAAGSFGVVARREKHAIRDGTTKNCAGKGVAFDAAAIRLGQAGGRARGKEERDEKAKAPAKSGE